MRDLLRRLSILCLVVLGTIATVATSQAPINVAGQSDTVRLTLTENDPVATFTARARITDSVVLQNSGQIGVTVSTDLDAEGGVGFTLTSQVSDESQGADIVDVQAQGEARVGIRAFNHCDDVPCEEEVVIDFELLDGDNVGLTFQLDGLGESADGSSGTINFTVQ